jgi:hypothetical protein
MAPLKSKELDDGIAFWKTRPKWPADLHNADYRRWYAQNPQGNFTLAWWGPFLSDLKGWIATRPATDTALTIRFTLLAGKLDATWAISFSTYIDRDITTVTWDQVKAFPDLVADIKPVSGGSPVFPSKFCHFLLPKIFPVVDNEAMGNPWPTYKKYFQYVQNEWSGTSPDVQAAMRDQLVAAVNAAGGPIFNEFPIVTKIVELCVIGGHT